MNKNCSRCLKVVYPIEELKCLDKTWHKTCFKCHECGMTLNMKTYKGYNKLPYCEAHIPKAKATAIADTPELKRIAENTKIQSNVQYHADFEKQKGKLTQVADDPETLRIKQNTKQFSNVAYHGDLEKKAAMEKQREVAEVADNRDNESEYFSETLAAESLYQQQSSSSPASLSPLPPLSVTGNNAQQPYAASVSSTSSSSQLSPPQSAQSQQQPQQHYAAPPAQQHHQQQQQPPKAAPQYNAAPGYKAPPQPQQQLPPPTVQQSQHHHHQQQHQAQQVPPSNNHQPNSGYHSQTYGGPAQQLQPQPQLIPQQNYNHIRHSVLQSSVNPSGAIHQQQQQQQQQLQHQQLQQQQQQAQQQQKYYDQYDNYARPNVQNTPVTYNNNNHSNGQHHAYQQQQQQPPQNGGAYNNHHHHHHQPQHQQAAYNSTHHHQLHYGNGSGGGDANAGGAAIGKISDYDPLTDGPRNVPAATRQSATLIYNSSDRGGAATVSQQPRKIGSISDIDPANGIYGSIDPNNGYHPPQQQQQYQRQAQQQQQHHQHQQQQQQHLQQPQYIQPPPAPQQQQLPQKPVQSLSNSVRIFRALYDYEAEDSDEVSFAEGDVIFEVESIDAGWMTGRVERTGQTGMLPANYVQPAIV